MRTLQKVISVGRGVRAHSVREISRPPPSAYNIKQRLTDDRPLLFLNDVLLRNTLCKSYGEETSRRRRRPLQRELNSFMSITIGQ